MQTIKERETHYDDESGYSDYKENNDLNAFDQSNATLSMSHKDPPNRPAKVIDGLAQFLLEEHEKRLIRKRVVVVCRVGLHLVRECEHAGHLGRAEVADLGDHFGRALEAGGRALARRHMA